jgi:hypothetical protein
MQRLITPDGAKGLLTHNFDAQLLTCVFSNPAELDARGDARGPSVRGLWLASPTLGPHRRGSRNQPQ